MATDQAARAYLTTVRAVLSEPISSTSHLLTLLLPSLDLLDLLPGTYVLEERNSWEYAARTGKSPEAVRAVLNPAWLTSVQTALIERVLVDWKDVLKNEQVWDVLVEAWFCPEPLRMPAEENDVGKEQSSVRQDAVAAIALSSYRTILPLLSRTPSLPPSSATLASASALISEDGPSERPSPSAALHPITTDLVLHILPLLVQRISLAILLRSCLKETNAARRELEWKDVVRAVVGLPTRMANFTKGEPSKELEYRIYMSRLAIQFETLLHDLSTGSIDASKSAGTEAAAHLLSKLIRTGYTSDLSPVPTHLDKTPTFWGALLPAVLVRQGAADSAPQADWDPCYIAQWRAVLGSLSSPDRESFELSLVSFLDSVPLKAHSSLVAPEERTRPGRLAAEGRSFLGPEAARQVAVSAGILQFLCGPLSKLAGNTNGTVRENNSESGTDEDEDEDERISRCDSLINTLILPSSRRQRGAGREWSPLMARIFAFWATSNGEKDSTEDLENLMERVALVWSDPVRVRGSSLGSHQYLATLLLSLCGSLSSHPSSTALQTLSRSPHFLHGVSAYLDNLDPAIRRLGMLIAEVISERTVSQGPGSGAGTDGKGPRPLNFGAALWDGAGDGREEARVLRALVHGVRPQLEAAQAVRTEDWARILGLVHENVEPISNQIGDGDSESSLALSVRRKDWEAKTKGRTIRRPKFVAPPSRTARKGPLIVELDESGKSESVLRSDPVVEEVVSEAESNSSLQAYVLSDSDDEVSSSSGSDSFAESLADASLVDKLGPDGVPTPNAKTAKNGVQADLSLGEFEMPKKKRLRVPVYVGEVAPLLRSNERGEVKMGLKHVEAIVRRKAGWGGEVDENAVDLAYALCGLQNNFSIKQFDERRTVALTALIVASPRIATGCIIEQYFHHQYSLAQRFSMLTSVASGALELSGLSSPAPRQPPSSVGRPKGSATSAAVDTLADNLASTAITRAKTEGEARVPSIAREKALSINAGRSRPRAEMLAPSSTSSSSLAPRPGLGMGASAIFGQGHTHVRQQEPFIHLASSTFIFPLLNRFWAHLTSNGARSSRRSLTTTRAQASATAYEGAGTSTLFSPLLVSRFLDTLAVLSFAAKNSPDFSYVIVPEVLQLVLTLARDNLHLFVSFADSPPYTNSNSQTQSKPRFGPGLGAGNGAGPTAQDATSTITGAAASLALVLLDTSWQLDSGKSLISPSSYSNSTATLLSDLSQWAERLFEYEDSKQEGGSGAGTAPPSRSKRASAALVLRIAEMREIWRKEVGLRGVGVGDGVGVGARRAG